MKNVMAKVTHKKKAKKDCFNKAYKIIKEKGWIL